MLMPYLSFNGNCEEAFKWYLELFGGRMQHLSNYPDGTVMHGVLQLGEHGGISGSDAAIPVERGNGMLMQVHFDCTKEAETVFAKLATGGEVSATLATNPPPDNQGISGCVKDKYGITWIISALQDIKE